MRVRTVYEFGQLIKARRHTLGMSQGDLAEAVGASRKWVVEMESGKQTTEFHRVLRALSVLDISLNAEFGETHVPAPSPVADDEIPDINDIIDAYGRKP